MAFELNYFDEPVCGHHDWSRQVGGGLLQLDGIGKRLGSFKTIAQNDVRIVGDR